MQLWLVQFHFAAIDGVPVAFCALPACTLASTMMDHKYEF